MTENAASLSDKAVPFCIGKSIEIQLREYIALFLLKTFSRSMKKF